MNKDNGQKSLSQLLYEGRVINLVGEVNMELAYNITSTLLYLDSINNEPIHLYINSGGGSIYAGLDIIDTMKLIKSPVYTYVKGIAASMGTAILTAGEPGYRFGLPNATVMIHQASSGNEGNIQDIKVAFEETTRLNDLMAEMIGKSAGKTGKWYKKLTVRDNWMTTDQAQKEGLIDFVVRDQESVKEYIDNLRKTSK